MIKKLMDLKNNNRNKFIVILIIAVISIIAVLVAITTSTLALFYDEEVASNAESYTTGVLDITATSRSSVISLSSTFPMTDESGLATDPYVFTITNTGNLDYKFDVKLLSTTDTNNINSSYIKLQIDNDTPVTLASLSNGIIKNDVVLEAKESIDISIRVWLDINTPNTEIGKVFTSKIVTNGQAIYTSSNYDYDLLPIPIEFNYTGDIQEYFVKKGGMYLLEVWGASGGYAYDSSRSSGDGGYGGYSKGIVNLESGQTLYVVVGGEGDSNCQTTNCPGGYNGGSDSSKWAGGDGSGLWTAGGGGATHIATRTGVLSSLSNNVSDVLIVAGGGGGGDYYPDYGCCYTGGNGGGITGGNAKADSGGTYADNTGGSQEVDDDRDHRIFGVWNILLLAIILCKN